jgi:hypothetical protein
MVLAVTTLEQPVCGHAPVPVGGRTLQAHAGRLQGVHAQRGLIQSPVEGLPVRLVTQRLQPRGQPVVTDVQGLYRLSGARLERVAPLWGPGGGVGQPMRALGEPMRQPHHTHPAQAPAYPMTMRRKMLVHQGLQPQAVAVGHQYRQVIDAFTDNGQGLGHDAPPLRPRPSHHC